MVGWPSRAEWANVDIYNLLSLDPSTTKLTWEIVNVRPRQIARCLQPNAGIQPPPGVSLQLMNALRSDLYDLLHPIGETEHGELHQMEPTPASRIALANALHEIEGVKFTGYKKTWDAERGMPGNWLGNHSASVRFPVSGVTGAIGLAHDSYTQEGIANGRGGTSGLNNLQGDGNLVRVGGSAANPIALDEDGTVEDPIDLTAGSLTRSRYPILNSQGSCTAIAPLHQLDRYNKLTWAERPAFQYTVRLGRLREMAQKHTNQNKGAMVIGVIRQPDWDAAIRLPEYICIAALDANNSMYIRVKLFSIYEKPLEKWPGGGSLFVTIDEIVRRGYLFRPFHEAFNNKRLKAYLIKMKKDDRLPTLRDPYPAIA